MSDREALIDAFSEVSFSDWPEVQSFVEGRVADAILSSDWLAAHDAERRAEWEAERGETEWEYIAQFGHVQGEERITAEAAIQSAREVLDDYPLDFPESELPLQVLRRLLARWLPVPDTTNEREQA